MDGQNHDKAAKTDFYDQVERVAKVLPLGLAGLYVIGFLIVALHLAGYGASPLDLIRIQYLAAGFWFICAFAIFYACTLPFSLTIAERFHIRFEGAFWRPRAARLLAGGIVIDTLWVAVLILVFYVIRGFGWLIDSQKLIDWNNQAFEPIDSIRSMGFVLIVFDIALRLYFYLKSRVRESPTRELEAPGASRVFSFFVGVIFVSCTLVFSSEVYPKIPFSYGGGQPLQVVFWLGTGTAADSFLERDHSNPYTVPYELLSENENSLVVISPKHNQRAIEFDRKAVGAVIVLGNRPKTAPAHFQRGLTEPQNNNFEVIERSQKQGLDTEVDYVLLHDGHKFYAACHTTTLDKPDPAATCGFRVLRSYECVQPDDKEPKKVLSDLKCKDDEGHPVYLYVSKKE